KTEHRRTPRTAGFNGAVARTRRRHVIERAPQASPLASMEPSRERDGDLSGAHGSAAVGATGFNGAVARTRRRHVRPGGVARHRSPGFNGAVARTRRRPRELSVEWGTAGTLQ